jgi:hypothetical protein
MRATEADMRALVGQDVPIGKAKWDVGNITAKE